jgi:hypothetical protein
MLDDIGKQNFARNLHEQFIQPEIERRQEAGTFPDEFKIRECLIRLPKDGRPLVEFNREFGWLVKPKLAPALKLTGMALDRPVYNHEIVAIERVFPPEIDGQRVSFIYLFWTGFEYCSVFDFSPNQLDFDPAGEFELGQVIADHLQHQIVEITVSLSKRNQAQLHQIGLWPVTSLLPYPISHIVERVGSGHPEEARQILVTHCNATFVAELVETWQPIQAFERRMALFREAVENHANQNYHSSIHTLIPHIEGVITDWLMTVVQPDEVRWRPDSKIRQFKELVEVIPQFNQAYREAFEAVCQFLLEGPPLQRFQDWLEKIDPSFPGRHPVAHGRYEEALFNEENSIKLFLMLDTVCQFMMFYEARRVAED